MVKRVEELRAYQEAQRLCEGVYRLTLSPPFKSHRPLADQLQRAAVSVVSNMAEGFHCRTKPQLLRFFDIAIASAGETRSQLFVARAQGLAPSPGFEEDLARTEAVLRLSKAFVASVRASPPWASEQPATLARPPGRAGS